MTFRMGIRLFQHRGIWYVEIDEKRRSLKTRDKAEARRLYTEIRKEYLAGKLAHLTGKCNVTLGQFRSDFISWSEKIQPRSTFRSNRLILDKLIAYLGESTLLDRVGRKTLDQLAAKWTNEGLAVPSINNYVRHARAVFNKAVEWGHLQSNPLSGVKQIPVEKLPPRFLLRDQATRFIAGIQDMDRRRLIVAYLATGRRRSELLNIEWQDVDLQKGRYFVRKAKRHLCRFYPINGMFRAVLTAISPQKDGRIFGRWEHPDTLSKIVKQELVAAGYSDMHLHHLRHTFASLKVLDGTPLRVLQELLGHTEYRTTEIYAHVADDHLAEEAEINLGPVDLGD